MRFGINLRGDLAKLDDAEIAARYERLISEKEAQLRALPNYAKYRLFRWLSAVFLPGRGLLHARIFYKIQAGIIISAGILISLTSGGGNEVVPNCLEEYLRDCELKDTRDEIKRRLQQRRMTATS